MPETAVMKSLIRFLFFFLKKVSESEFVVDGINVDEINTLREKKKQGL